ncbi:MAG: M23 family metallopeptidase, partial [Bacteroidota bacterium]
FWKNLEPGDKVKFRAILQNDQVVEFPVALEGTHPEKIVSSYLKNKKGKVIKFDNISFKAQIDMSLEEFEEFLATPLSIIRNGKKFEGPVSLNCMQAYRSELGSYYNTESKSAKQNYIILKDYELFEDVTPGEVLVIDFSPEEKPFGTGKSKKSSLRINIKGEHPLYQKNPSISWGGKEIEGTTALIKFEDIDDLRNTLPTLKLNGSEFVDPQKPMMVWEWVRGENRELRGKHQKLYDAQEFQQLINRRLDYYQTIYDREKRIFPAFAGSADISIPTPGGPNFKFKVMLEDFPINYDGMYYQRASAFDPNFRLPLKKEKINRMSSGFGQRVHPITKEKKQHRGIDFVAPLGTKVLGAALGEVIEVSRSNKKYGNKVVIQHAEGYRTVYAHLQSIAVKEGEKVNRGQHIGTVGSTGESYGPHLHFEILKDKKPVDPAEFLPSWEPED